MRKFAAIRIFEFLSNKFFDSIVKFGDSSIVGELEGVGEEFEFFFLYNVFEIFVGNGDDCYFLVVELDFFSVPGFLHKPLNLKSILLKICNNFPHLFADEYVVPAFHQHRLQAYIIVSVLVAEFQI